MQIPKAHREELQIGRRVTLEVLPEGVLIKPVNEIGYTLPQLFIARHIVRYARKKWWLVGPNIPVRFVMLLLTIVIIWLGQGRSGLILLAFFICFGIVSFGDGLVDVPWTDLVGSSLDKRWRARMFGLSAAISGVIMLLMAFCALYVTLRYFPKAEVAETTVSAQS